MCVLCVLCKCLYCLKVDAEVFHCLLESNVTEAVKYSLVCSDSQMFDKAILQFQKVELENSMMLS